MELHGFLQSNLELDLLVVGSVHDVVPLGLQSLKVVGQVGGLSLLGLLQIIITTSQESLDLRSSVLQVTEDLHKSVKLVLGSLWESSDRLGGGQGRVHITQPGEHILHLLVEGLGLSEGILKLSLPLLSLVQETVPLGVELIQLLLGVGCVSGSLLSLNDLSSSIVESVHTGLMGLDVVDDDLELSQLDLDDLRISIDRFEGVQSLVSSLDPDQELVESVLELAEPEEGVFELLLSDDDGLVEVGPSLVDLGQGLLDSPSLVR